MAEQDGSSRKVGVVRMSIESIPEALAVMRREMAKILRREADLDANLEVSRKLKQIANAFEAGLGPINDDIWRSQTR